MAVAFFEAAVSHELKRDSYGMWGLTSDAHTRLAVTSQTVRVWDPWRWELSGKYTSQEHQIQSLSTGYFVENRLGHLSTKRYYPNDLSRVLSIEEVLPTQPPQKSCACVSFFNVFSSQLFCRHF